MAWTTIKCTLNHDHRVYLQEKTDECAIACAAMVLERKGKGELSLADLRQESQDHKGGYRPSTKDAQAELDASSFAQRMALANAITSHLKSGRIGTTTAENLPDLLKGHGVSAVSATAASGDALRTQLKNASKSKPHVIRVAWDNGGGHAVMVDRHTRRFGAGKDQFCVCDPGSGVVVLTFSDRSAPPGSASEISDLKYTNSGHVRLNHVQVL